MKAYKFSRYSCSFRFSKLQIVCVCASYLYIIYIDGSFSVHQEDFADKSEAQDHSTIYESHHDEDTHDLMTENEKTAHTWLSTEEPVTHLSPLSATNEFQLQHSSDAEPAPSDNTLKIDLSGYSTIQEMQLMYEKKVIFTT